MKEVSASDPAITSVSDPCEGAVSSSSLTQSRHLLRDKLFLPDGSIKPEYIGQAEGYPRFADDHFDGDMQKTFQNVSAVSTKQEMADLGWKAFQGSTTQFNDLIEDFINHYPDGWIGLDGQQRIADQIFRGNRIATYKNVSVLRVYLFGGDGSEFRELGWSYKISRY